jgi:hypothetical protein
MGAAMLQILSEREADTGPSAAASIDLVAGTPVLTMRGELPVDALRPDDRLISRAGAIPLAGLACLGPATVTLFRISARALGHDRPDHDVLLSSDQPILLRDWRAKAMFGTPAAVVPVSRLADGTHVRQEPAASVVLYRLTLPRAAVIYAAGLELAVEPATVTA